MNITAAHTYSHSCDATVKRVVHFLTWRCQFSHLISGAGEPEGARRIQATSSATSLPDEGHPRSPPLHNQSVSSPTRSTTFLTTCYTPSIRPPSPSTSPRLLAFPASLHPPPTFAFHPFSLFVFYPPPRPALSLLSTLSNSPVYSLLKPLLPLFFSFSVSHRLPVLITHPFPQRFLLFFFFLPTLALPFSSALLTSESVGF